MTGPADGVVGWNVGARPSLGPPELWATARVRRACAERDVAALYRCLGGAGVSQRAIAAATGQSQSEISEILRKGRRVRDVTVLERICDGMSIPRSWFRLTGEPEHSSTGVDNHSLTAAVVQLAGQVAALVTAIATMNDPGQATPTAEGQS